MRDVNSGGPGLDDAVAAEAHDPGGLGKGNRRVGSASRQYAVIEQPLCANEADACDFRVGEFAVPQFDVRAAKTDHRVFGVRDRRMAHRQLRGAGVERGAAEPGETSALDQRLGAIDRL